MTLARSPLSPKLKSRKCICGSTFMQSRMGQQVCSPKCAYDLVAANKAKEKAVAATRERVSDRAKRESLKSRADHLKDAQRAFNAWIRERDAQQPCICCGRAKTNVEGLRSHGWDAGHYRSVGSAPHLRFHEDNVHRQLVYCNRDGAGNAVDYRIGLIARIGLERVEALEADQEPRRYTMDELIAIKTLYRAKLRALTKEK